KSDKVFFVIGLAFVVLAAILKVAAVLSPTPVDGMVRNRLFRLLLTVGLCEVAWFGARYENVSFFGSHFLALLILLIGLVWFGFIAKYFIKGYASEKSGYTKEQMKLKYLPKQ
ncbi:MAG TPA: hypothetical protein VHA30_03840, partial [Patescibacteria group bacterium]|nr:hypothetical protein [Patescibacteria group bacterium]